MLSIIYINVKWAQSMIYMSSLEETYCQTTYSLRVADRVSRMIRNMLVRWMSSCCFG
jgi:hypothetical protein